VAPSTGAAGCDAANQSFSTATALLKNSAAITLNSAAVALFEHLCESLRQGAVPIPNKSRGSADERQCTFFEQHCLWCKVCAAPMLSRHEKTPARGSWGPDRS